MSLLTETQAIIQMGGDGDVHSCSCGSLEAGRHATGQLINLLLGCLGTGGGCWPISAIDAIQAVVGHIPLQFVRNFEIGEID